MTAQADPRRANLSLPETAQSPLDARAILFVGLSLSIGWGIRGNFGHSYGAMLPGALAAMAMALISGRADWQRRIAYFALFGAIGWAFGASQAYMVLIAYCQSGDSLSVWYGFMMLFVVGFLWGALGGAGTAIPAYLKRERVIEFFVPMTLIFASFGLWDAWSPALVTWLGHLYPNIAFLHDRPYHDALDWFDTDWPAAALAVIVPLCYAAVRRKFDKATSLILHLSIGWWIGFLLFPNLLHIRMLPPKSEDWSGILGLFVGLMIFLRRDGQQEITFVTLVTGFVGGVGFATATLLKQLEMTSGYTTNWHSILEQTYGLINGIGIAVAMLLVMRRAPTQTDDPPTARWTEAWAVFFILILLTYVNVRKVVDDWLQAKSMPEQLYFLTAGGWFDLFYAGIAITALILLIAQLRRPLPILGFSWLARGQLMYLTLLWWMDLGNIAKQLGHFEPMRLVTEGTIFINGLLCTLMALLWTRTDRGFAPLSPPPYAAWIRRVAVVGLAGWFATCALDWAIVRAVYGDRPVAKNDIWIRFGPRNTNEKAPD